jgi:hypothetical protein
MTTDIHVASWTCIDIGLSKTNTFNACIACVSTDKQARSSLIMPQNGSLVCYPCGHFCKDIS